MRLPYTTRYSKMYLIFLIDYLRGEESNFWRSRIIFKTKHKLWFFLLNVNYILFSFIDTSWSVLIDLCWTINTIRVD